MDSRRDDRDVESSRTQYPAQYIDGRLAQTAWSKAALRNGSGDQLHSAAGAFLFCFRILAQSVGNHMVLRTDRALALTPRTSCGLQHHRAHRAARNTTFLLPMNLATLVSVGREEEAGGTVRVVKLRVGFWNLAAIGL